MMRSMFSGVSGLRVHQTKMDVIGNNIANVNTVGYKASSVQFAESFSQILRGAGSPQGGRGGTNPQQVGLGVQVSSLDVNHSKGSAQRTDRPLDLMIDGNGFFCITNDPNFQNKYYTRAGNFTTDELGNVVTPSGFKLLGIDGKPIRVDKSKTKAATQTSKIEISGNVNKETVLSDDPTDKIAYTSSLDVFDSLGSAHTVTMNFGERLDYNVAGTGKGFLRQIQFVNDGIAINGTKTGKLGALHKTDITTEGTTYTGTPADGDVNLYVRYDEYGNFQGIVSGCTVDTANGGVVTAFGAVPAPIMNANQMNLQLQVEGAKDIDIPLYNSSTGESVFEKLTGFSQESTAVGKKLDGNGAGFLDSFNVSASGEFVGIFTNGEREVLGQILLASFDNNVGLQKIGNNMFVDSVNSGMPKFGAAGSGSFGAIAPGALEMSNVDLSAQFTDMITTQRGFQANSRVVTTSDEMLQELVNLKR